jgi:hypothetical protein
VNRFYDDPERDPARHGLTPEHFLWRAGDVLLDSKPYVPSLPYAYILSTYYLPGGSGGGRGYNVANVDMRAVERDGSYIGVGMVQGISAEIMEDPRYSYHCHGNGEAAG